jgi:hypothetical protein
MKVPVALIGAAFGIAISWLAFTRPDSFSAERSGTWGIPDALVNLLPGAARRIFWLLFGLAIIAISVAYALS